MAKRELIDRNNLESTTIVTDDFSGNEMLDVVLMEDVKEAPVITEQDIVKPYLDKIRAEMLEEMIPHSGTGEEVIQAYADGLKKGLEILDKYKAESEG